MRGCDDAQPSRALDSGSQATDGVRSRGAQPSCDFAEAEVWKSLGGGWQCLHGGYSEHGLSIEWHDFNCDKPRDWARTFHPGSLEVCLNLSGYARLECGLEVMQLGPTTTALYNSGNRKLSAWRLPGARHQFLTFEFSSGYLRKHLSGCDSAVSPIVRSAMHPESGREVTLATPVPLKRELREHVMELRTSGLSGPAAHLWHQAKALEMVSHLFFPAREESAPAPLRRQQLATERVGRVREILDQQLAQPPTLRELGRLVGCSPYYLSRTFSREMGMTIPQFIRQIRMERAAELLKSGKRNVTEAALEVGYNSLSHFSHAFCEVIGCCPGLYPLGLKRPGFTPRQAQRSANK